jgi:hypothetical protein
MINKINKERQRSTNATPTRPRNLFEQVARSPGGPQTKTGQSAMRSTDRSITNYKMKHKKKS